MGDLLTPSRQGEDELQGADTTNVSQTVCGVYFPLTHTHFASYGQDLYEELAMSRDEDLRVKCASMGALVVLVQPPCKQVGEIGRQQG